MNDWPIVRQFDFDTLAYADILNLGTITTLSTGTFAGALSSSATSPEKLAVLFGGTGQDRHFKVSVFRVNPAGAEAVVLDTHASTITTGGSTTSTNITLGISLHHAWLDQSGRPTGRKRSEMRSVPSPAARSAATCSSWRWPEAASVHSLTTR